MSLAADHPHCTLAVLPVSYLPGGGATVWGNKAWNLMRLANTGLASPPAFVLSTAWSRRNLNAHSEDLRRALAYGVARLEAASNLGFGSSRRPLLVSVRSGSAVSMPGMLATVLNVGLNRTTLDGMLRLTGNPRLGWDSYRRFVQNYAEVVTGLPAAPFDTLLTQEVAREGVENERELDYRGLRATALAMLGRYEELAGAAVPSDPMEQLVQAVLAVFRSWNAPKAVMYRKLNGLSDAAGTAITVQMMVFGNAGARSGAGVGFTRDPATGARELYFDFCLRGQGEDIVSGRRTPMDSEHFQRLLSSESVELQAVAARLEAEFRDAQDFEFTVQEGRLWLLQTRDAKRTPWAALRVAVDMVDEGLITPAEALQRLADVDLSAVVRTRFALPLPEPVAHATVAGLGVSSGAIALDTAAAERLTSQGQSIVLVRQEAETEDIAGVACAAGLLTVAGSRTSHAAVVARQLGKVCLVGCRELRIDLDRRQCWFGGLRIAEGDQISVDGNEGVIYSGALPVLHERPERELAAVASWRAGSTTNPAKQ